MTAARVIVLGSINVDVLASVGRLPVAGETIAGNGLVRQLGGKGANQAVAAARAGGDAVFLGATGSDEEGATVSRALAGHGVDIGGLARIEGATGHAVVLTSPSDNQIVVIAGANGLVGPETASAVTIGAADVCLAQMEVPVAAVEAFFARGRAAGATTILNAAPASAAAGSLLALCDILIVNESELALLAGTTLDEGAGETVIRDAIGLLGFSGTLIVTLGARGVLLSRGAEMTRLAGHRVRVVDTTGAGDCFCGYVAAALARGDTLEAAAEEANLAASIAVQALGAASAMPDRSRLRSPPGGA